MLIMLSEKILKQISMNEFEDYNFLWMIEMKEEEDCPL